MKKLKDPVLQERTKMRRSGWNKAQLSDIKFFKNEVGSPAVDLALTETARDLVKPRHARQSPNHSKKHEDSRANKVQKTAGNGRRSIKRK